MIKKVFTNEQAMAHLAYAITCGYSFEKFIFGKGVYGNRVSLMRNKDARSLYGGEMNFKGSTFHAIEGIKALELPQTIIITRQKLESFFVNREFMLDFLENYKSDFATTEDLEKVADTWYNKVSKKLLVNKILDFNLLNNFIIGSIILLLPITTQFDIAEFRKEQILTLLTQEVITESFAEMQLALLPASQEKLVALKQKMLKEQVEKKKTVNEAIE